MTCIRTGAVAKVECYNLYIYGDMHKFLDTYIFRAVNESYEKPFWEDTIDYIIGEPVQWFDRLTMSPNQPSTLIALPLSVQDLTS